MFKAWKQAWKEAVDNFRRELDPERYGAARAAAMRRDLARAESELERLEGDLARSRSALEAERAEEARCRRQEALATNIADHETARLAAQYAARHAERAAVLEQKVHALEAEHALMQRDLEQMSATLGTVAPDPAPDTPLADEADRNDADFHRLEQEARERAAEARLEELKRRMR
jgi:hypothetical protein